jgi:hypothetical protein
MCSQAQLRWQLDLFLLWDVADIIDLKLPHDRQCSSHTAKGRSPVVLGLVTLEFMHENRLFSIHFLLKRSFKNRQKIFPKYEGAPSWLTHISKDNYDAVYFSDMSRNE